MVNSDKEQRKCYGLRLYMHKSVPVMAFAFAYAAAYVSSAQCNVGL